MKIFAEKRLNLSRNRKKLHEVNIFKFDDAKPFPAKVGIAFI